VQGCPTQSQSATPRRHAHGGKSYLLHTLPRSFAKVRYYGLFSPAGRPQREQARTLLPATAVTPVAHTSQSQSSLPAAPAITARCPFCQLANCDYSPSAAPATTATTTSTTSRKKGPAMKLTCARLTQTDTAALAFACLTPALASPLSTFRVSRLCEERKPVGCLKTTALPLQLLIPGAKISGDLANFHRR